MRAWVPDINHPGHFKSVVFSLSNGLDYNKEKDLLTSYDHDNMEINMDTLQLGFNLFDRRGREIFLGDVIKVNSLDTLCWVDASVTNGIVLRDLKSNHITYDAQVSSAYFVSGPFTYKTIDRINGSFKYPKYAVGPNRFNLLDVKFSEEKGARYYNKLSKKYEAFRFEYVTQLMPKVV